MPQLVRTHNSHTMGFGVIWDTGNLYSFEEFGDSDCLLHSLADVMAAGLIENLFLCSFLNY